MDVYFSDWRRLRSHPAVDEIADSGRDFLTAVSLAEIRSYLCNTLLRDADWASMASSLELRVPFLGRRYIEAMLSFSWDDKLGPADARKPLLRELVNPKNRDVISRNKTGFFINYAELLTGPMKEVARTSLNALTAHFGFKIDPDKEIGALEGVGQSVDKRARRVWALVALGSYANKWG
jgi:asparagine synthase (glutamine-hydrolysing)